MPDIQVCSACGGGGIVGNKICETCWGAGALPLRGISAHVAKVMEKINDTLNKCNDIKEKCDEIMNKLNE